MENLFSKFVYTGVGFVSLTTEKIKTTIENLVSEDRISEEEGRKIVDDFIKNTETKREELESQFSSIVEKIVKSFNFASIKEMDELNVRLEALEDAAAKLGKTVAKAEEKEEAGSDDEKSAKKTTSRKKTTKKADEADEA